MKYKCTAIDIEGTDVKFPGKFRVGEVYNAVAARQGYVRIYDNTEAFFAISKVCFVDNTALFHSGDVTISFSLVEPDEAIMISREGNKVCALLYRNGERVKTAEAACAPCDTFDFLTGASIAMNRLVGDHAVPTAYTPDPSIDHKFSIGDEVIIIDTGCCYTSYDDWVNVYVTNPVDRSMWVQGVSLDGNARRYRGKKFKVITYGKHRWDGNVLYYISDGKHAYVIGESGLSKPLYNGKVVCLENKGNECEYTVGKIYQFKDGLLTTSSGIIFPAPDRPCSSFEEWQKWSTSEWLEIKEG